jgi:hypothetical protein
MAGAFSLRKNSVANKLYEYLSFDKAHVQLLEEDNKITGGKDLCMKGVFIQGDVRNQNQRVYPAREIARAVNSITEKLNSAQSVMGELDHPEELSINLDRVSHLITEMWMEGADGYGKLKIVPTPMGNIVKTLLQSGAKLGVSSRGSGNVGDDGGVSDFEIITVDIVAQPSAPNAFPRTIYESLFNMKGGSRVMLTAREALTEAAAQKQLVKDIHRFIQELKI